jgi:hypothetical protein
LKRSGGCHAVVVFISTTFPPSGFHSESTGKDADEQPNANAVSANEKNERTMDGIGFSPGSVRITTKRFLHPFAVRTNSFSERAHFSRRGVISCHLRERSRGRTNPPMRKLSFPGVSVMMMVAVASTATRARADETLPPLPPPATAAPQTPTFVKTVKRRKEDTPLFHAGMTLFAMGWGGAVLPAVPSGLGLMGRFLGYVGLLGLPLYYCDSGYYFCSGTHGSLELVLPVFGPLLYAADHPKDSVINPRGGVPAPGVRALLYASSAAQTIGIALFTAALVLPAPAAHTTSKPPAPKIEISPMFEDRVVGIGRKETLKGARVLR